jgi:anti-sigma factor RsiW
MKTEADEINRWEEIEKYLNGQMTGEEKRRYDRLLAQDAGWRREVDAARRLRAAIGAYSVEQRMLDTLQRLQREEAPGRPARSRRLRWYFTGLAAACLAGLLYFTFVPVSLPEAGYDITVIRSAEPASLPTEQRLAFEQFFVGQAHMAEGQYVQAAGNFEHVLQTPDLRPYFREAAQWHLAVSYLRSGQPRKAGRLYRLLDNCDTCEYRVNWLTHAKMRWQLTWQQWLH